MTRWVQKPWGHEEIWAETPQYLGKILVIEAGARLSLQHHEVKDETIRVLHGELRLELDDASGVLQVHTLGPGDSAHIPPRRRHRFAALTRCEVLEVSTPHPDDVVRHQDDYGRVPS